MEFKTIPSLKVKMSCCNPKRNPLNGFTANTESGRLRKQMAICRPPAADKAVDLCCTKTIQEIKPTITPTESSYLASKMINCGVYVRSGAVPQDVAKALFAKAGAQQQYGSEGVRIEAARASAEECGTDPFSPTARFSNYERMPESIPCPPLPPPPAPPARQCILQKNQKYY